MRRIWGTAALLLLLSAAACGSGHGKSASTTTTAPATTTTVAPETVTITPPSGPVGTTFGLAVKGFSAGENLHFEIDFPNGHTFVGGSHPVKPDGTFSTTYQATAGNPTGTYTAKAIGDQGETAQANFQVTTGPQGGSGPTTSTTAGTSETLPGD